jgi:hypothetical protein
VAAAAGAFFLLVFFAGATHGDVAISPASVSAAASSSFPFGRFAMLGEANAFKRGDLE